MSFRDTIIVIESMMNHRRPHMRGYDHACSKCLLAYALELSSKKKNRGVTRLPSGKIVNTEELRRESALAAKGAVKAKAK